MLRKEGSKVAQRLIRAKRLKRQGGARHVQLHTARRPRVRLRAEDPATAPRVLRGRGHRRHRHPAPRDDRRGGHVGPRVQEEGQEGEAGEGERLDQPLGPKQPFCFSYKTKVIKV